ncbi:Integrin alpha beta-propellor repeat-containing protein, partial [Acidovorax sp. NO-1]
DLFGTSVALSGDGNTLAVGAQGEDSNATGINGDPADNSAASSGAVYVY